MSIRIAAGLYKGQVISTVAGPGYRPAMVKVRQALFSMLEARAVYWEDARALDLYAGSGSLGLEALSRGAAEVWFVEQSAKAVRALRQTLVRLGVPGRQYKIVTGKVARFLRQRPSQQFDLVFIDPPYGHGLLQPSVQDLLKRDWVHTSACIAAEVEAEVGVTNLPGFSLEVNRTYGQTRIVIWKAQNQKPQYIQEPLTL
jgi:16S rRNA (guanine966-N2)-methyltransferase